MDTKIFIPQKIKVGYQERSDTYTKRLAYVIYYDQKGKLRKEASWKSWCELEDKEITGWDGKKYTKKIQPGIPADDFDNVPTEGFVLNKGVGGVRDSYSSWNPRNEYIRVWDPRNFEFEISIANLLYILENTSSIKGKGLDGKLVYGWWGTDLVLIPENAPEFQAMQDFTELQSGKISAKTLKPGYQYQTKKQEVVTYMGYFPTHPDTYGLRPVEPKDEKKKHWFCSGTSFAPRSSLDFLAKELEQNKDYADLMEKMEAKVDYAPIVGIELEETTWKDLVKRKHKSPNFFIVTPLYWIQAYLYSHSYSGYESVERFISGTRFSIYRSLDDWKRGNEIVQEYYPVERWKGKTWDNTHLETFREEIKQGDFKLYAITTINKNGKAIIR
jgi:hypothetical protein